MVYCVAEGNGDAPRCDDKEADGSSVGNGALDENGIPHDDVGVDHLRAAGSLASCTKILYTGLR